MKKRYFEIIFVLMFVLFLSLYLGNQEEMKINAGFYKIQLEDKKNGNEK